MELRKMDLFIYLEAKDRTTCFLKNFTKYSYRKKYKI